MAMEYSGILLVDKPVGETSFASIAKLRKLLGIKRIGHCGTLDPFADGLLPICVGRATATVQFMTEFSKTYEVTLKLGESTNTQDCEGEVLERVDWREFCQNLDLTSGLSFEQYIAQHVASLTGELWQEPPMHSAVKVDGKPLYYYARQGQEIERAKRKIMIYSAEITDISLPLLTVRIHCSKGTYIRSWCDQLGRKLGCFAHAITLRRLACGGLSLSDKRCVQLEELFAVFEQFDREREKMKNYLRTHLLKVREVFKEQNTLELSTRQAKSLCHGQPVRLRSDQITSDANFNDELYLACLSDLDLAFGVLKETELGLQFKPQRVLLDQNLLESYLRDADN